ncbi:MAG: LacI family DNA-binding transcriptional regulator [Spirochaetia bacterium]|jgi:DNA-binding LacI/PurR family transcriptional regulator
MLKPRLRQVAEQAGVSLTTASMVLAGKGKISPLVRERVVEAALKIGYQRRSSRSESPGTITLLLPFDDQWAHTFHFIRPIIVEIERTLIKAGYYPVIVPTWYSSDVENTIAKILANEARAVFSIHYGNDALFRQLEGMGIPVVVVNNNNYQDTFYSVCVDDFQGAYEGCLHLIRLGHTEIGYVDFPRPDLPAIVADRFIGFQKAMDEFGIPFDASRRVTVPLDDRPALREGLRRLFSDGARCTALFIHDDYFAARVISELAGLGLKVPDDVSVMAPGDVLDYSDPFVPQITTMRINTALMGQISADLILNRMRRNPDDIHVLKIKQQLADRGSCRRREK